MGDRDRLERLIGIAGMLNQSLWQSETENLGLAHEPVVAMRTG